jgi:exopolysaccharide production protein ExoZ
MKQSNPAETIVAIQVLRAVAALAVVFSHAAFDLHRFATGDVLRYFHLGDAGVDLFFVISGFVMVYASEPLFGRAGAATVFFVHRLVRIVPLYWLATTFYVAMALTAAAFAKPYNFDKSYDLQTIAASYLFIPLPRPDGVMQPMVGQGWTLNYEMFFYAIFALSLLAPRRVAVTAACCTLLALATLGRLLAPLPPPLAFWTDTIVLEFALGMLLGVAYRRGTKLAKPLALLLIFSGMVLFAIEPLIPSVPSLRFVTWGVPAAMVVTGATCGRFVLQKPTWRIPTIIGDASYALYLFHPMPIRAILLMARRAGFDMAHALWFYVPAGIATSVALALAIHFAFERPVTSALRRRLAFVGPGAQTAATKTQALPAE